MMKRYYSEGVMNRHAAELYQRSRHAWWKLRDKRLLIAGAGGLGTFVLANLLGSGIGEIVVVDRDKVEPHNLNRQFFYGLEDVGRWKVEILKERLSYRHENISFKRTDIKEVDITRFNVVVDCLDRWKEKSALIDRAIDSDIPIVSISAGRGKGMVTSPRKRIPFTPKDECIVSTPELSVAAGIGSNEVINTLTGNPRLVNKLLVFDLNTYDFQLVEY